MKKLCLIISLTLLLLLAAFSFRSVLSHQLINSWDDNEQITNNQDIRQLKPANLRKFFTSSYVAMYAPLTTLSYALEYRVAGLQPQLYHLTNLSLHLLNILLVYWLSWLLFKRRGVALVSAALFALWPTQVEPVAWLSARSTLLSSTLILGTLISYRYHLQRSTWLSYALVSLLLILALLAKAVAVSILPLLLLLSWQQKQLTRRRWLEAVPWLLAALLIGWLTVTFRQQSLTSPTTLSFPWFNVITLWHYSLLRQLGCLLWPFNGQLFYQQPFLVYRPAPWFHYAVNLSLPLLGLLIYLFRRQRQVIFYLAWFLINISLSISITPFIEFPASDRYNYLALLALAWPLAVWFSRPRRRLLALVAVIVIFAWSVNRLNANWHDELSFWRAAERQQPQSYQAHYNLAITLYEHGQLSAALDSITRAAALSPDHPDILNYQGFLLTLEGRQLALAEQLLNKALTINSRQALPHINLSRLAITKRDWNQARQHLDLAAALINSEPRANYDLWYQSAFVALQQHQLQRAEKDSRLALSFSPQEAEALYLNGLANLELGRLDQACLSLRQAADLGQAYAAQLKLDLCQ